MKKMTAFGESNRENITLSNYKKLQDEYSINTPIFIEDLNNEQLKELKELEIVGKIKRFDSYVYYFPKESIIGESLLNVQSIIVRRYITNYSDIYGYISGLFLENLAGVSTQVPKILSITTNNIHEGPIIVPVGYSKVKLQMPLTTVTKENVNTLQFLDLLTFIDINHLDEYERKNLIDFKNKLKITDTLVEKYSNLYLNSDMILESWYTLRS